MLGWFHLAIFATLCVFVRTDAFAFRSMSSVPRTRTKLNAEESSLCFSGSVVHTSEPFPAGTSKEDACGFLTTRNTRDLLLSAGGSRELQYLEKTPELLCYWKEMCDDFYGRESMPSEKDELIGVSTNVQFPGVTLTSVVCLGVKLRKGLDDVPVHEVIAVADKQEATGLKPVVWLFNQLTGAAKRGEGFVKSKNSIKTVVSLDFPSQDSIAIRSETVFKVVVSFPRALLKVLPTSKEKMEEQGSNAIRKAVTKDVQDSVVGARNAFDKQRIVALED